LYLAPHVCKFKNSLVFRVGVPVLRKSVGTWLAASSSGSTEALSLYCGNTPASSQYFDSFVVCEFVTAVRHASGCPILSTDGTKVLGIIHTVLSQSGKRVGTRSCAMLEDLKRARLAIPEGYGKQASSLNDDARSLQKLLIFDYPEGYFFDISELITIILLFLLLYYIFSSCFTISCS
jgi:hypothetical protein